MCVGAGRTPGKPDVCDRNAVNELCSGSECAPVTKS